MNEANPPTRAADDATTSTPQPLATALRALCYGAGTARLRAVVRKHMDAARVERYYGPAPTSDEAGT